MYVVKLTIDILFEIGLLQNKVSFIFRLIFSEAKKFVFLALWDNPTIQAICLPEY